MTSPTTPPADAPARARELAARLAAEGEGVIAVLLYGSHLLRASPDPHSAFDFVVVVRAYAPFYRSLRAHRAVHRPVGLFVALSAVLPPNVIAYTPEDGRAGMAKCLVVRRDHLEAALAPHPRDHFLLGRLVQKVALVWPGSGTDGDGGDTPGAAAREVLDRIREARSRVLEWMGPFLDGPFTAEELGGRLLEVCYRGEFRPEARNRAGVIFEAQREHFARVLAPGLEAAAARGELIRLEDGRFELAGPVPAARRLYWRFHFIRSKLRVTLRWPKHVLTFDNWLPYIVRKVERRTGMTVELTPRERRWPLLFLWPRALRILRSRPESEQRP